MRREVGFSEEFWRIVNIETGFGPEDIIPDKRDMDVCMTREVIGNILMEELGFREKEVGKLLGRDRATAIYWRKMHQAWIETWAPYRDLYNRLSEVLADYCDASDILV